MYLYIYISIYIPVCIWIGVGRVDTSAHSICGLIGQMGVDLAFAMALAMFEL